ncbi:thyroid receptor-interacting protein 6 isoform X3 [Nasonia vitripennis]|uniref:Zyxin n=2 Tax=Nasonia vitripennis TaxID=7425 RepID=A0A7M7IN04_NASVI|nr:thyroid receptor-interacting protein 6 isoform X3 [Nasonia vitripennis]
MLVTRVISNSGVKAVSERVTTTYLLDCLVGEFLTKFPARLVKLLGYLRGNFSSEYKGVSSIILTAASVYFLITKHNNLCATGVFQVLRNHCLTADIDISSNMSNIGNLEQDIASLQLGHDGSHTTTVKTGKKVGPAVPPKPKKSQPQVPQSYTIKAASIPSYSTVLNNTGSNEKATNLYMNTPAPFIPHNVDKSDYPRSTPTNGDSSKFYQKNENFYTNQPQEKFNPLYRYDDKNFYSNIGNMPAPQVPLTNDRANRSTTRNAVYSNIEPAIPIPIPQPIQKEKDIVYSNIQWNTTKPENTYCNIPAQGHSSDFPTDSYPNDIYGPSSQSSSTYESIYEPINPRPPSQLSCNYSMYSGYGSASQPQGKTNSIKEVDALTDLLVQGMEDNSEDSDIYGICAKCGKKVEGEGTGCSAMDQVFHISCFCCFVCNVRLQGKPFYSSEGKPYCEEDFLNTLEKCCVCTLPILDRILRATGKPYHPSCFTCVVCGQSLDGIPFTVDATNQVHCIQCFHKKFAPRCCVCKLPIMPEPGEDETVRVVALDRSFHTQCYKCEDCGLVLSSDTEDACYPLDDHVLCKSCNASRVQALTSHMTTEL